MFVKVGISCKKTVAYSENRKKSKNSIRRRSLKYRGETGFVLTNAALREHLKREYGWALRGVKVKGTNRGCKFHRVNIVAAVIHGKAGTKEELEKICMKAKSNILFLPAYSSISVRRFCVEKKRVSANRRMMHAA
ncbi:MAG: hypothetical protein LBE17_09555 [Treponema sp.]|jgi:hypothetical protein|nr:hypothetical protein [Treponema sp.]